MSCDAAREDLDLLLKEIEPYLVEPVVEWSRSGRPFLPGLAETAGTAGADREVVSLLRSVQVEEGRPEDVTGSEPAQVLFIHDEKGTQDSDFLLLAAARLAPGGFLLVCQESAEGDAAIPDGLRLRTVRKVGDCRLIVARRPAERPRVALFPEAQGACLQIRTLGPLEELDARGIIDLCVLPKEADALDINSADLLVLQRFGSLPAVRFMLAARRLGVPVAMELDDDFFNLPWFNPAAKDFGRFEVRLLLQALLRGADSVVVSTPYLKKQMKAFNESVVAMHNIVDTGLFARKPCIRSEPGVTTFGYIGTRTHQEDFRPVLEPLRKLILESGGAVRAAFVGHVPDELRRLPHVRYMGWLGTYHNAAHALSRAGVDVALAPLVDLEFNRSKSAMKFLEYGACGIPGIYSDVEAYRSYIRSGENGLLVPEHTSAAWEEAMRFVVDNPGERERLAENAWTEVRERHSIESRANEFWSLYREIMDRPAGRTDRGPDAVAEAGSGEKPPLSLIVNAYGDTEEAVLAVTGMVQEFPAGTQLIVIAGNENLADLMELSGAADVVRFETGAGSDRRNAFGRAVEKARADWVMVLDQRCKIPSQIAARLAVHARPECGAVAPRTRESRSTQSVQAVLGEKLTVGANLEEVLLDYASTRPSTPVRMLEPDAVLLNRAAVEAAGGIDERLIWDDALSDLCLRLRSGGYEIRVANNTCIETKGYIRQELPSGWRQASRILLRELLTERGDSIAMEELWEPSSLFGINGEKLSVWVWSRKESPYLKECLDRIGRYGEIPLELNIVDGEPVLDRVLADESSSHALVLHDGVLLTSGALREMMCVLHRTSRRAVVPFSNDGSPGQRVLTDRALSLEELDRIVNAQVSQRSDEHRLIEGGAAFCVLMDLEKIRRAAPASLGEITGAQVAVAERAYVHVLSHPTGAGLIGIGPWPGGPFDLQVPAVDEIVRLRAEVLADLGEFVSRVRPLLGALQDNPGNAEVLAGLGLLYLRRGEMDNGMSFIERARKMDPFSDAVRSARKFARGVLDSGMV